MTVLHFCSTNGTFLNWEKLTKVGPEVEVRHGDIISLSAPPQHGNTTVPCPPSFFLASPLNTPSCTPSRI